MYIPGSNHIGLHEYRDIFSTFFLLREMLLSVRLLFLGAVHKWRHRIFIYIPFLNLRQRVTYFIDYVLTCFESCLQK